MSRTLPNSEAQRVGLLTTLASSASLERATCPRCTGTRIGPCTCCLGSAPAETGKQAHLLALSTARASQADIDAPRVRQSCI